MIAKFTPRHWQILGVLGSEPLAATAIAEATRVPLDSVRHVLGELERHHLARQVLRVRSGRAGWIRTTTRIAA
jgi:DNA-binding IclR family transcriptional regulator